MPAKEAQEAFDGVEATYYDRVDGPSNQVGFLAQHESGKKFDDRELMRLDY